MKVVILAGGQQSTISDNQEGVPKPMAEVAEKPILWHIMKHFSEYGFRDFIICGGYKVNLIKDYFTDYYIYQSDVTVDLAKNEVTIHKKVTEDWKVTVVDTGLYSGTGQRISRIRQYIEEDAFIVSYGDCLSDVNLNELVRTFEQKGKPAVMAVAKPSGRHEIMPVDEAGDLGRTGGGHEPEKQSWVNAGIFVLSRRVFDYLQGNYNLEHELLPKLMDRQEITTYKHGGFWRAVETYRDKSELEAMWNAGVAPWKVWKD